MSHERGLGVLGAYARCEDWKREHSLVMLHFKVQNQVALGNALFAFAERIDANWHTLVNSGRVEYDAAEDAQVLENYRLWADPCTAILGAIERLERAGHPVAGAEEFRRNCDEVRGILADAGGAILDPAPLMRLEAEAIEAHRQGQTSDFHVLGD